MDSMINGMRSSLPPGASQAWSPVILLRSFRIRPGGHAHLSCQFRWGNSDLVRGARVCNQLAQEGCEKE